MRCPQATAAQRQRARRRGRTGRRQPEGFTTLFISCRLGVLAFRPIDVVGLAGGAGPASAPFRLRTQCMVAWRAVPCRVKRLLPACPGALCGHAPAREEGDFSAAGGREHGPCGRARACGCGLQPTTTTVQRGARPGVDKGGFGIIRGAGPGLRG